MRLHAVVLSVLAALSPIATAQPAVDHKIDPILIRTLMDDENGTAPMFVYFGERANLKPALSMKEKMPRRQFVVNTLQAAASRSQNGVINYLRARNVDFVPYWINNSIYIKQGDLELARTLARRPEVAYVEREVIYQVPPVSSEAAIQSIEWNIAKINADDVWTTFGNKGEGIVVANIDTGVQYTHPALVMKYRGRNPDGTFAHTGNWWDPTGICGATPCDNNGHGSHTMGTMVGDDGGSNQIGVAPGAKWIACKGCSTNSCSSLHLISCAQSIAGSVADVVNNSWGGGRGSTWYQSYVQSWVAAGIFPAFSIGNSGPNCYTSGDPGNYPESFASGMTDINDAISSLSSRGPSPFGNIVKPDVTAPGASVRSSVPTNGYAYYTGTSMASPHMAGAVALIWSKLPAYLGQIASTRNLLAGGTLKLYSSQGCGGLGPTASPNNVYGAGRIDVYQAILNAGTPPPPNQPPVVHITAPANGSSHACGTTVTFTGTATDPEQGNLSGSLTWTDSVNGALGTGGTVTKSYSCATDVGAHTITASATDAGGLTGTDTIGITVYVAAGPSTPANLTAVKSDNSAILTWTYSPGNPDSFKVYRRVKAKGWGPWQVVAPLVGGSVRSYTDTPGAKGSYQYYVTATAGGVESGPSNAASVKI